MSGNAKNLRESDSALMMSFAAGDCEGFEVLYRRYSGAIYRFFYFGTHGDKSLAIELFQDVWMTVIRGRARYTNEINFVDWLYHSAWARLHDHLRLHTLEQDSDDHSVTSQSSKVVSIVSKSRSIEELNAEESDELVDVGADVVEAVPEVVNDANTSLADSSLIDVIKNLDPEQKEVVLLRYCFSMTAQDIADFIDVGKSTVDRLARETAAVLRQKVSMRLNNGEQLNG